MSVNNGLCVPVNLQIYLLERYNTFQKYCGFEMDQHIVAYIQLSRAMKCVIYLPHNYSP